MIKLKSIFFVCASVFLFASCDGNRIFEENHTVGDGGWAMEDVKTFNIPITDTMSALNIYVNLCTSTDYPYSNIYLFMESSYPNGYNDLDTLDLILAQKDGQWLGENSGTVIENRFMIASGGRFPTAGDYVFKIQHAMQDAVLPEVIDVGMRVEIRD